MPYGFRERNTINFWVIKLGISLLNMCVNGGEDRKELQSILGAPRSFGISLV